MEKFQKKMGKWGEWAKNNPEEFQNKMQWCGNKMSEWGEWAKNNPEEFQNKMQNCGNKWNKNGWKEARAVCTRKPEQVLQIAPGMTQIVELEVLNDTYWPWKTGCTLTLADEQPGDEMPIDIFSVPIE